jgi:hypothetical protein
VHRDCAARCLSGGIPPALLTADLDGSRRLILLLGEDGKPLRKAAYLQRVGQQVFIHGYLDQSNTFYYLRTNAASIAPLP